MDKKTVLIITHSADNACVETVSKYVRDAGGKTIRFDVDRYPHDISLSTLYDKEGSWQVLLRDGESVCNLENLAAVWYRRSHHLGKGLEERIDSEYLPAAMEESRRTLFGMLEGLTCFPLGGYNLYRRLDSKEDQLKTALRHGLKIPPTCISNSPAEIRHFIKQADGPVVTKMQSSFAIYRSGREHVVFTSDVPESDLDDLDNVRYCPMIFQQKIAKKLELRVTVVGCEIFAFSIDSQKQPNARTDWRKEGVQLLNDWKPFTLPNDVKERVLAMMQSYGLNYGAIDLILTPAGEYYFLEINPAGEYFWLDRLSEDAISKQLAAVLLGNVARIEDYLF